MDPTRLIFLHGLEGTSRGVKATLLRGLFPEMVIPDFRGDLQARMAALDDILGNRPGWTIVGSSFGGLMGALFTARCPQQVRKLILLAPALIWPDFASQPPPPVLTPAAIYHGRKDEIIPAAVVRELALKVFRNAVFHAVDDDHGLYRTVHAIDWPALLGASAPTGADWQKEGPLTG